MVHHQVLSMWLRILNDYYLEKKGELGGFLVGRLCFLVPQGSFENYSITYIVPVQVSFRELHTQVACLMPDNVMQNQSVILFECRTYICFIS